MAQRLKLGSMWQDHDLVFATDIGTPLHPSNVNRQLVRLMGKAGVTRIPFHGLRHTYATLLLVNGVHPKIASERLGQAGH